MKFCSYDKYEPEDEDDNSVEELERLLKNFIKDAKSLKWETSTPEYWIDSCNIDVDGLDFSENKKIKDECSKLPNGADWCGMDFFSLSIEGNVLLLSSQTDSSVNGDYFDMKCTKFNKAHKFKPYNVQSYQKIANDSNPKKKDKKTWENAIENAKDKILKIFKSRTNNEYDKKFLHKCVKVSFNDDKARSRKPIFGYYAGSNDTISEILFIGAHLVYDEENNKLTNSQQTRERFNYCISPDDIDEIRILNDSEEKEYKKMLNEYIKYIEKNLLVDEFAYYTNELLQGRFKIK